MSDAPPADRSRPKDHLGREMMPEGQDPDILHESFPARRLLAIIGDKWIPIVLYCLAQHDASRFNELQRRIPDISKKMLTQTLRGLERDGLVERKVFPQVPPRTEYRLTVDGRHLRQPIAWLCEWAANNDDFLETIQQRRHPVGRERSRQPRHDAENGAC